MTELQEVREWMSDYEKHKNCKHNKNASYNNEGFWCDECGVRVSMYAVTELRLKNNKIESLQSKLELLTKCMGVVSAFGCVVADNTRQDKWCQGCKNKKLIESMEVG